MGRKRCDAIDLACQEWARARRKALGLDEARTAAEVLGPLRSTLGARRDLHAGAKSNRVEQHWPEVYGSEQALEVARAYAQMGELFRAMLDAHYVARAPIDDKAAALAMSRAKYFSVLNMAKAFVEGWLAR